MLDRNSVPHLSQGLAISVILGVVDILGALHCLAWGERTKPVTFGFSIDGYDPRGHEDGP